MTDETRKMLENAGYDVNGALARFVNNENLYFMFMKKFKNDENYMKIEGALAAENYEEVYSAVHALKSVAGNLGIQDVFEKTVEMLALIKGKSADDNIKEPAYAIYEELKKGYDKAVGIIDTL